MHEIALQGLFNLCELRKLACSGVRSFLASLIQIDVSPRILEHLQPWAGFPCELIVWLVAHLHRSETAFWVWHHDGGAAVACCEAGGTCWGTVWIGWIHFRCFAFEVNVAGCDLIAREALLEVACSAEVLSLIHI